MFNLDDIKDEQRGDILVNANMKKLWFVQLKILEEIKRICKKFNIEYFAMSGTLLGAIRHNGYIPWDDDVDLGMTRSNYDRFIEVAKKELNKDFFLQCNETEKNFFRVHLQVRYNDSCMLTKGDFNHKYNMGIWVDIFPFDKIPNDNYLDNKLRKKVAFKNRLLNMYMYYYNDSFIKKVIKYLVSRFYVILNGGLKKTINKYDKLVTKYKDLKTDFYYDELTWEPNVKRCFSEELLTNLTTHKFEDTEISIPLDYHSDLLKEFGPNYMTPIKAPSCHGETFIDFNNSYKKYQKISRKEFLELFNNGEKN